MNRTEARAGAMKLIYEWDMGGDGGEDTLTGILELTPGEREYDYMRTLIDYAQANIDRIDANIEKHTVGWKLERLMRVDLAILRIATCEMLIGKEPFPVIINEAIELSHTYSTEKAPAFINGVLGNMSRSELV